MTTKLTLTVERSIIAGAKEYAQKTGRSLSDLIESYLELLISNNKETDPDKLPPKLKKLFGSANISVDLDHKKEIRKILRSKHKL